MANETIKLSRVESDIALLTFDNPDKSANVLSRATLDEFSAHLDTIENDKSLTGLIIISGKPGTFLAGADIREFAASIDSSKEEIVTMSRGGQDLFARLSKTPYVTVVAIDGICVGGGAELSVWCDRRILTDNPKTQFGFPEVKLGLYPGWGGTARTPRMIGLYNALEIITSGNSLSAREAAAMGLADDVTSADDLLAAAVRMVRDEQQSKQYQADRQRWSEPIEMSDTEMAFLGATASGYIQQQTKGHYPAPLAALELLLEAAGEDLQTACQMEADGMAELFGTPINASLINVFLMTDRNKKNTGVDAANVEPREVKSVGVIGAGIMGSGIAAATVRRKLPVTMTDNDTDSLAAGVSQVLEEVSYNKEIKGPDVKRAVEFAPLVNGTTADTELAACDLIIEAIIENPKVKRKLYERLEPKMADDAILASNTSTIPISTLAADLQRPDRFCGIHFFNPVRKMPLVEVIRGEQTSDETVTTAVAYAKRISKSPIVVNDGPGFCVNRLLMPYLNESVELLLDGASIKQVERASKQFGMPMGPITLFDVIGLDTAVYAGKIIYEAFRDRTVVAPLLPELVKAGRLGQKSGAGFFKYDGKKNKPQPDPAFDAILSPLLRDGPAPDETAITERMFLPMLLEATRMLAEGVMRDVRDVDLALIFGIGFPPFKGGLLFWADTIGAANIVEQLKPYEHLGERFKPTPMLLEMAADSSKFYDQTKK